MSDPPGIVPAISLRLLGPVAVSREGVERVLPRSRKVRVLLGFLALSPRPVTRSRLTTLLWDVPNDPRGELRWCLSKLRGVLDDEQRRRVVTSGEFVSLDLADCLVDALAADEAERRGLASLALPELAALADRFAGDILDGVSLDGNAELTGWLAAQRNRYRELHAALLSELVSRAPDSPDVFRRLESWLQLSPFDPRAHEAMLRTLVGQGRLRDAEEHLGTTIRSFEQEGVDWAPLRESWRAMRERSAPASRIEVPAPVATPQLAPPRGQRRASVAVMPFTDDSAPGATAASSAGGRRPVADGLTEDIIMQLAKLRALFVIGRGTVFSLAERGISPEESGRLLKVDYLVSGRLSRGSGQRLSILVELAETHDGRIVWTDALEVPPGETLTAFDELNARIVAAIAEEIEMAEIRRAMSKPPGSLDAWEAYHRGLWHMYRFNGPDNRRAQELFRGALGLDPTFSRAHAGLSFTHFQNAFLGLTPDRGEEIDLAFRAAGESLAADDRDPVAHWAMGRALWLRGAQDEALAELHQSTELSPNFALGHYTVGFVQSQAGDPRAAIVATDHSRQLSPFDPLQFGMLGSRALAHVRLDEHEEAARWAVRATSRPNAHEHILAIAAQCLGLAGRLEEARAFVARIRQRLPGYGVEEFLRAFRFEADAERRFRHNARRIGFDS